MWHDIETEFEIYSEYPHQIRNKITKEICKEWTNSSGYQVVKINDRLAYKHRLIAETFIPCTSGPYIDHIDHDKSNNRVENLRWCSAKQNSNNRSNQERVSELPATAVPALSYNLYILKDLYYDPETDTFYRDNGIDYNKIRKNKRKRFYETDAYGRQFTLYHGQFRKQHGFTNQRDDEL